MAKEKLENINENEAIQVPKCYYGIIAEELPYPSISHCNMCDGYDYKCEDYKTEGQYKEEGENDN